MAGAACAQCGDRQLGVEVATPEHGGDRARAVTGAAGMVVRICSRGVCCWTRACLRQGVGRPCNSMPLCSHEAFDTVATGACSAAALATAAATVATGGCHDEYATDGCCEGYACMAGDVGTAVATSGCHDGHATEGSCERYAGVAEAVCTTVATSGCHDVHATEDCCEGNAGVARPVCTGYACVTTACGKVDHECERWAGRSDSDRGKVEYEDTPLSRD
mmetsp:Transcript_29507/g.74845  ORF Transcript_29507/g.74845 Transcript_29507/m.74845 type:complete len:219 (-) Transcript_29507:1639-2295(-)